MGNNDSSSFKQRQNTQNECESAAQEQTRETLNQTKTCIQNNKQKQENNQQRQENNQQGQENNQGWSQDQADFYQREKLNQSESLASNKNLNQENNLQISYIPEQQQAIIEQEPQKKDILQENNKSKSKSKPSVEQYCCFKSQTQQDQMCSQSTLPAQAENYRNHTVSIIDIEDQVQNNNNNNNIKYKNIQNTYRYDYKIAEYDSKKNTFGENQLNFQQNEQLSESLRTDIKQLHKLELPQIAFEILSNVDKGIKSIPKNQVQKKLIYTNCAYVFNKELLSLPFIYKEVTYYLCAQFDNPKDLNNIYKQFKAKYMDNDEGECRFAVLNNKILFYFIAKACLENDSNVSS